MRKMIRNVAFSCAVVVGAVGSGVVVGCGSTDTRDAWAGDAPEVLTGSGALLTVEGLGCPMCAESIHVLLDNVDGVADSDVNLETGIVDVSFVPGAFVQRSALASAVIDGGFSLRGIESKD